MSFSLTRFKSFKTQSLKSLFEWKKRKLNNSGSGKWRQIFSKLSGAFMLPISVMSIAGLLLGVGAAIASNSHSEGGKIFGQLIQSLGDPVFAALPVLFAMAFVIAFTDEAGVAVFATLIGYLVFVSTQSALITPDSKSTSISLSGYTSNDNNVLVTIKGISPNSEPINLKDILYNNKEVIVKLENIVPNSTNALITIDGITNNTGVIELKGLTSNNETVLITIKNLSTNVANQPIIINSIVTNVDQPHKILFTEGGRDPFRLSKLIGSTLGFTSLQTSVFGGIAVGLTIQWLYRKFHTIQLPQVISFFGGKRFVSIITIPVMFVLALLFLLFWPWIGIALNEIGTGIGQVPYGFESLIFGYIERSLIPFGLHHVFYAPLWYSSVGGDAGESIQNGIDALSKAHPGLVPGANTLKILADYAQNKNSFQGDSTASLKLLQYGNYIDYTINGEKHEVPLFTFLQENGFKVGRFADGKFSGMMFGLPAAAAAMVMAAPKENRKVALGTVVPAAVTSFVTGVTEPIEFTFLFLSPVLFWGFHASMMALSFFFANLAGVHIPMAFSGGVLDLLLYGIIPVQKGTNFWWVLVIGLGYAPIYYLFFYWFIKYKDLATPGRGQNTRLFTKADYLNRKDTAKLGDIDPQVLAIVEGYGGIHNITNFNNCASRLRYDVKDASKVSEDKLKAAGAIAIKVEGNNHVQAILGPVAEQLNAKIKSQRNAIIELEHNGTKIEAPVIEKVETELTDKSGTPKIEVFAPAKGQTIQLSELNDGVFSKKLMGDGFAIKVGKTGIADVFAPISGVVEVVFESKHAIGITSEDGSLKTLIHIGIDTVNLQGKGFENFVQVEQKVQKGEKIASVNLDTLVENNVSTTDVIFLVLPESKQTKFIFSSTNSEKELGELVGFAE